jgi:hypothetical protein
MSVSIPVFFKKIFKQVAKFVVFAILWILLFYNFRIKKNKGNYLPFRFVRLCFNDYLVHFTDPKLIKRHIADPNVMPERSFIWSGDWDIESVPLENHEKYILMKELFVDRKKFAETGFYDYATKQMTAGCPVQRGSLMLDSPANIESYFKKNQEIIDSILKNGFNLSIAPEVGLAIGRNGEYIHFRQGHHTMAIAQFLNENKVKVRIRAVHSLWLEKELKDKKFLGPGSLRKCFNDIFK